jgi:hypothetical protein
MKYQSIHQLANIAHVFLAQTASPVPRLSLSQRLSVWAVLLERAGGTLRLLQDTEFKPWRERDHLRDSESPLAVAFADPLLRSEGLTGDSYGDARQFFGLGQQSFHHIVCHCLYRTGTTAPAGDISARVLKAAVRANRVERMASLFRFKPTGAMMRFLVKSYV